jgi:glycosyltransferase involved in cell wall biosynthesis
MAPAGDRFTVTFTVPHQMPTAGGVYAIQQFARNLTSMMDVNLVVRRGDPKPLPGVSMHSSETFSPAEIPDADAIVLHINAPESDAFFELPDSKGEQLLLFQGYSDLGSEMVRERLSLGLRVLAVSGWLVKEAEGFGARVIHTPLGLDREIFHPGPPTDLRPAVVAMKSHPTYWKGTADGIAALQRVKQARPDVELRVFGARERAEPLPLPHTYLALSSQAEVAELFRASLVYVCPSWEEGFGMPGLEALACGTALATTDTKGSRDYALDGETALVSPPRDPEQLAQNVLRLLEDLELRRSLCARGIDLAQTRFHGWRQAAEVMGRALKGNRSH